MMERNQFVNRLMEMMQEHFGDEYELERTEVTKNNGIVYDAVILHMEDSNAVPVVYLDYLYEDYLDEANQWYFDDDPYDIVYYEFPYGDY